MKLKNFPEVRFKGYSKEWQERAFADIFMERHEICTISADYPQLSFTIAEGVIRPENRKSNKRDFLIKDKSTKQYLKTEIDDIIYNPANVVYGAIHRNKLCKGAVSPIYKIFQTSENASYMECIVRNQNFIRKISSQTEGTVTKLKTLKPEAFLNMKSCISPYASEQADIGSFFTELDSLIEGKRAKLDKLKKLKLAYLGKMFPKKGSRVPEVRFKGFSGDWDEKRLGDIAGFVYGGGTPRTSEQDFWNGDIPWLQSSDIMEDDIFNVLVRKRITQKAVQDSATRIVPKNSIAIVARVGVGKIALVTFDFATSQDFTSLSNLNIDELYAAVCIKQLMLAISNEVQGTSIKGITKDELLKKVILVPKGRSEQCKIGAFFQNLDKLINLQQQELDKLSNIKSACLSKMFA